MHRTNASPAPINLITTWTEYIRIALKSSIITAKYYTLEKMQFFSSLGNARKNDNYKRMKNGAKKGGGKSRKIKGKISPVTPVAGKKACEVVH